MEATANPNYKKNFVPFALAAALLSLCGGFTAAIPNAIVADWGIDAAYNTWITLVYAMGAAACAPLLGKLSDLFGRRMTTLLGIAFIGIGEISIGIASNVVIVLVGRFVVGLGGAAIAPTVIGYITSNYPPTEMAKGFTLYMVISTVCVIFGPAVGGIIMQATNWRVVMYVCAAMAAVVFVVCLGMLKKNDAPKTGLKGFDVFGGVCTLIFFSFALSVPTFGQSYGWANTLTLAAIGIAVVAVVVLYFAEKKAQNPILNGKFMARKEFILPIVVLLLTQGLMQACMTNTIIFVRFTQPANNLIASLSISIMYVGMTLGTLFMGPQADKKEPRYVAAFALLFCAAGAAIQFFFKENTGFAVFAASLFLIGLGLGGNATIFMKVALSGLSPAEAGAGSGTYSVFRDLAAPFGVALFVPMFTSGVTFGADQAPVLDTVLSSMHNVALTQVVCVAVGIAVCLMLPKVHNQAAKQ